MALEISHDSNGHAALACDIEGVGGTQVFEARIEVVAEIALNVLFYLTLCSEILVHLHVDAGGYGLRTLDSLWVVVSYRCGDARQFKSLVE